MTFDRQLADILALIDLECLENKFMAKEKKGFAWSVERTHQNEELYQQVCT